MATAIANNVTKRSDVDRRLTYLEMDENFQQLKNAIQDIINLEVSNTGKVNVSTYNSKMASLDNALLTMQNNIGLMLDRIILLENEVYN